MKFMEFLKCKKFFVVDNNTCAALKKTGNIAPKGIVRMFPSLDWSLWWILLQNRFQWMPADWETV